MPTDEALLGHVQHLIHSGKKQITLPADLMADATDAALTEVRQLCKLCGVKIAVEG